MEFLHFIIEHSEVMEANGWAPRFEKLPPIEDRVLTSEEKPPKLELKPLPSHLKFAFLGVEETFPVIIVTPPTRHPMGCQARVSHFGIGTL